MKSAGEATTPPSAPSANDSIDTVPCLFLSSLAMWSKRETLQFTIKLGLRKGLALIRGMRRSLTDDEQDRVADTIVKHLELSNWKIEEGRIPEGHGPKLMGE